MQNKREIIKGKAHNMMITGNAPQEEKQKIVRVLSKQEQENEKIIRGIWKKYNVIWKAMIKNQNWEDVEDIFEWSDEAVALARTKEKECIVSDKVWQQEKKDIANYRWEEKEKPMYDKNNYF